MTIAVVFSLLSFSASSDYAIDSGATLVGDAQDLVVVFSQDLTELKNRGTYRTNVSSVKQACLSLTLAQMLRNPMMNGGNEAVNVTLFLRNEGVKLADTDLVAAISEEQAQQKVPGCVAPWYPYPITLAQHLGDFLAVEAGGDNNLVNCPICWCGYMGFTENVACAQHYLEEGYPGVLNPAAISPLFLGAEKVIDF